MWNGPIILMFMSRCTNVMKFKLKRLKIMGIKNPFVLLHTLKIPMYTVPLYKLHYLISETFFFQIELCKQATIFSYTANES